MEVRVGAGIRRFTRQLGRFLAPPLHRQLIDDDVEAPAINRPARFDGESRRETLRTWHKSPAVVI